MDWRIGVALLVLVWVVCGVLAYGLTLASFQRQYKSIAWEMRHSDMRLATVMAIGGPLGLITALVCGRGMRHGLQFKPTERFQALQDFTEQYPNLNPYESGGFDE